MTLETVTSLVHRHHVGIRIHSYMTGNGAQSTPEMTFVIGHAGMAFTQTGRFRALTFGAFAVVYILWGSTYLAIAVAVESIPPFLLIGVRSLAAGAILLGFAELRNPGMPPAHSWALAAASGASCLAAATTPPWPSAIPGKFSTIPSLSHAERRAILTSWASDARAVEDAPWLRRLDNGANIRLSEVLEALKALDSASPKQTGERRREQADAPALLRHQIIATLLNCPPRLYSGTRAHRFLFDREPSPSGS
jgi:hypothetical protein